MGMDLRKSVHPRTGGAMDLRQPVHKPDGGATMPVKKIAKGRPASPGGYKRRGA